MERIEIDDNHRRGIGTALRQLDKLLSDVEDCAKGRQRQGVLFREVNPLTDEQQVALLRQVASMREVVADCGQQLALPVATECVTDGIWGSASAFWEVLVETSSKHLRRYGTVPDELAQFLDPRLDELIRGLVAIVELTTPKRSRRRPPAHLETPAPLVDPAD